MASLNETEAVTIEAVAKMPFARRRAVAADPATAPEVLASLTNDRDVQVREKVATNESTPTEALAALALDHSLLVRLEVALNANAPAEALTILADDETSTVARAAEVHSNFKK